MRICEPWYSRHEVLYDRSLDNRETRSGANLMYSTLRQHSESAVWRLVTSDLDKKVKRRTPHQCVFREVECDTPLKKRSVYRDYGRTDGRTDWCSTGDRYRGRHDPSGRQGPGGHSFGSFYSPVSVATSDTDRGNDVCCCSVTIGRKYERVNGII